jgi:hypothetical protein
MNCELASHLIDDYLENRLSQRDRTCLEEHLSRCPSCAQELYRRPTFDRDVRKALTASVLPLRLAPTASRRIVQASQDSVHRAIRFNRFAVAMRASASALAAILVVVGVLYLSGFILGPSPLESLNQIPGIKLPIAAFNPADPGAKDLQASQSESAYVESWTDGDLLIEPLNLKPGEPFTMTVILDSHMPQSLNNAHLNIDINGPSGYYHFVIAVKDPLPAHGVAALRVTPELLSAPCQERYLISPADIFGVPGAYAVRVTLSAPVARQNGTPR